MCIRDREKRAKDEAERLAATGAGDGFFGGFGGGGGEGEGKGGGENGNHDKKEGEGEDGSQTQEVTDNAEEDVSKFTLKRDVSMCMLLSTHPSGRNRGGWWGW